jgi:anti-sigma factor RsiW
MQDRIADYVLGALDAADAEALREHLSECSGCRQYLRDLQQQSESLVELGRQVGSDMTARQDRVIDALKDVTPVQRVFPFVGGLLKTAVAAVLLLGVGIGIGRWTAPRPVDVERLRSDLEASLAASIRPAVQTTILAQVDQRLQAEAQQRTELARLTYQDLHTLAEKSAAGTESLEKLMNGRFAELVDVIEAGRETDRWRVEKALQEMKTQTGLGLQALAVRASDRATTVHD